MYGGGAFRAPEDLFLDGLIIKILVLKLLGFCLSLVRLMLRLPLLLLLPLPVFDMGSNRIEFG